MRHVGKEDTGARGIQLRVFENGLEAAGIGGFVKWNTENLEAVEIDGFVVENVNAGTTDGVKIVRRIAEFLVIAGDEVRAEARSERLPRSREAVVVDVRAVEHVTGDEDDVGPELAEGGDQAPKETAALDVAEVGVGDEGGDASTPGSGEAGEFDGDAINADLRGVEDAVEAGEKAQGEEEGGDARGGKRELEELSDGKQNPGRYRGQECEVENTQPDRGEAVEDADRPVEVPVREKSSWHEGDR